VRHSKTNQRSLVDQGAVLVAEPDYIWMVLLHSVWLAGAGLEVALAGRRFLPWLGITATLFFLAANGMRYWAIKSLSHHWNTQVVDSARLGVVTSGPYRWMRHPNYAAVVVELAALPLIHTAYVTAAVTTLLHIPVMARRIRLEESVLMSNEQYRKSMGSKPRFLP
jgi:methyltransferase